MQRQKGTYQIASGQYKEIKDKMLNWANRFSILVFLDSNGYTDPYSRYECLAGVGSNVDCYSLDQLHKLHTIHSDWFFGHICYDYKNELEPFLSSRHETLKGWSDDEFYFFRPQVVCYIDAAKTQLCIETLVQSPQSVYEEIIATVTDNPGKLPTVQFNQRIGKQDYIDTIQRLRKHIEDGDCYEINYCNEGYAEDVEIDPLQAYIALNRLSPAPFAAYYANNGNYLMCASPERYLYKNDNIVLSQPIKGTAPRDADEVRDNANKEALYNSIKERAENVMIVDLVRNDLARSCDVGSVQVNELFGIYSFPQVHQMISTVSGRLKEGNTFTDAIRDSFPMGSMTGAPKIKVMELIDLYEQARRELFSGCVGYITPSGDMDLNVIIRSLFYNEGTGYLSYQAGGAITYDSDPAKEWEEMRLKASAVERIFKA